MTTINTTTLASYLATLFASQMELHLLHNFNAPAAQSLPFKPKLKELGSDASRRAEKLVIEGPREDLEQTAIELVVIENIFRKMDCNPETIRRQAGHPEKLGDMLLQELLPRVRCAESLDRLNLLIQATLAAGTLLTPATGAKNAT